METGERGIGFGARIESEIRGRRCLTCQPRRAAPARSVGRVATGVLALGLASGAFGQALHWLSQPEIDVGLQPNASLGAPGISVNGQYATFISSASNLIASDTNQSPDAFITELATGDVRRVSELAGGGELAAGSSGVTPPTSDGRWVVFTSSDAALPGGSGIGNAYLKDLQTGAVTFIADYDGGQQFQVGNQMHLSDDARYLTFQSTTHIDPLHTGTLRPQVYRKDLQTGLVTLISLREDGTAAASNTCALAAVSPNGRYVVFSSRASNLIDGVSAGPVTSHVYLADTVSGQLHLVTVRPDGLPAEPQNLSAFLSASVSNDGRVAHISAASDLVVGDSNGLSDAFVYHQGQNQRVYLQPDGQQVTDVGAVTVAISGNGTRVYIASASEQLVADGGNGTIQLFTSLLSGGAMERLSNTASGAPGNSLSVLASASLDGQRVVFQSDADDLTEDPSLGLYRQLYTADLATGDINLASRAALAPSTSLGSINFAAISSDQMTALYVAGIPNLNAAAGTGNEAHVHLLDRHTNVHQSIARRVTTDTRALSPSGRYVVFRSRYFPPAGEIDLGINTLFRYDRETGQYTQIAAGRGASVNNEGQVVFIADDDLVPEDENGLADIYLFDQGNLTLVSRALDGGAGNGNSSTPSLTSGGGPLRIAFTSGATNLVPDPAGANWNIFLAELPAGTIRRVTQTPAGVGANGNTQTSRISTNGTHVVFSTGADNLTSDDYSNAYSNQVLVYNVATQNHELVSRNSSGQPLHSSAVLGVSISDSGRWVAYSTADFGPPHDFPFDTDNAADVLLFDRDTGITRVVSQFIDGSNLVGNASISQVVEDLSLSPPRVGVAFTDVARLSGVENSIGTTREAYLYQRGGPPLTLEVVVDGDGTVSGSFGIHCSGLCTYNHPIGTNFSLVASAGSGGSFLGWENDFGPCNHGSNPCQLSLDRDQSLIARFGAGDQIFANGFEPSP